MESNRFMEWLGRVGIFSPENIKARKVLLGASMLTSTGGWLCMLFACLALTRNNFDLLTVSQFSNAVVDFQALNREDAENLGIGATDIYVGLRSVAWTRYNVSWIQDDTDDLIYTVDSQITTPFEDFCTGDSGVYFVEPSQCDDCEKVSAKLVTNLLMSTIFYFFTFKNDWCRFHVNYDVNCQKFSSSCIAIITIALALNAFFKYNSECFESFLDGDYCYKNDGSIFRCNPDNDDIYNDPTITGIAFIDWKPGAGVITLGIGVFARVFSFLCNLAIPTPTITRNLEEQWEYERIANGEKKIEEEERSEVDSPAEED